MSIWKLNAVEIPNDSLIVMKLHGSVQNDQNHAMELRMLSSVSSRDTVGAQSDPQLAQPTSPSSDIVYGE